jgi:hypothetical protein
MAIEIRLGRRLKLAVQARLAVIGMEPLPQSAWPLQPSNLEPLVATGVRVTAVPLTKAAEQLAPQLIPAGVLVTVPLPAPVFVTVSPKLAGPKLAVTVVAAASVTVQVPIPAHPPPLHPANVLPAAAVAVSVTAVSLA